jgi:hypothetical protein
VEGGRVALHGSGFSAVDPAEVTVGDRPARTVFVCSTRLILEVPAQVDGGDLPVRVGADARATLAVGTEWATGLHQVDSPLFDDDGNLFATYSGPRGQEAPVSVFRVSGSGTRAPFASGIVNPTSMARGPDGCIYVSSRFDGSILRLDAEGGATRVAEDLGVACGLAFDVDGRMYVGDRTGTIFRVRDGEATSFATLPPSIAAFHLAMSPQGELFVTAPTLGSYDHVYRIGVDGDVEMLPAPMGRPQGLAFSPDGILHVADALAGSGGIYRFPDLLGEPERVVAGNGLIGLAFGPRGELVVASNETLYRFQTAG